MMMTELMLMLLKIAGVLFLIYSYVLPGRWHAEFCYYALRYTKLYKVFGEKQSKDVFAVQQRTSRAMLLDCDLFGHKSNSTYFREADMLRLSILLYVLGPVFRMRGKSYYAGLRTGTCLFRREIPLFRKYITQTKIVGWDHESLYVAVRFVLPGTKGKEDKLACMHMCSYVFKDGYKTVPPEEILDLCELDVASVKDKAVNYGAKAFNFLKMEDINYGFPDVTPRKPVKF
ncbi:hypothetical protein CANCADRAFT_30084 [Tortispora caseinolytica NRRL Y-17796]|uniref:Thioesterase domain-containing protein n=1 Tax=Tortispora caseinolytica NRRL Y-17796 TaxID=767744 RepID=A0A1E4TJA0_9ASCO|nr:hypothetical protein CANCADRAFT_30084 [Tortispora caseinolytica NRRL Y-17796]